MSPTSVDERTLPTRVAATLELRSNGPVSWDALLDGACALYWTHRPRYDIRCGSEPGYRLHLHRHDHPCPPCTRAAATMRAIRRRRHELGVPEPDRRSHPACAGHIALGMPNGTPTCPWCLTAAKAVQREVAA